MHELGLARDFFESILQRARSNNLARINKVIIRVGVASGIEKDFLKHSFVDHVFPGTLAEGSQLLFIDEPVRTVCKNCEKEIHSTKDFSLDCPFCGSYEIEITGGKDIVLEEVDGPKTASPQ